MDEKTYRNAKPYVAIAALDIVALTLFLVGIVVFWKTPFSYPWAVGWHGLLLIS